MPSLSSLIDTTIEDVAPMALPQLVKGPAGVNGTNGVNGSSGNLIYVGTVSPPVITANSGDLYVDTSSWNVYRMA